MNILKEKPGLSFSLLGHQQEDGLLGHCIRYTSVALLSELFYVGRRGLQEQHSLPILQSSVKFYSIFPEKPIQ